MSNQANPRRENSAVNETETPDAAPVLPPRPAITDPFLVTDQAGDKLLASITVHASTPLVAVGYVGDPAAVEIVPEHELAEVARRFRRARPKAVTAVRPVRSRRVVATVVVDVPDSPSGAGIVDDAGGIAAPGNLREARGSQKAAAKASSEPGRIAENGPGRRSQETAVGDDGDRGEASRMYPGPLVRVALAERRPRELYDQAAKERQGKRNDLKKDILENLPESGGTARDQAGKAVGVSGKLVDAAHLAGVGLAERLCREGAPVSTIVDTEESLTRTPGCE